MGEPDDFVTSDGADLFDPEVANRIEELAYERSDSTDAAVREFIEKRRRAYTAVFQGKGSEGDVQFVMLDLAHFCRAYAPTFHPHNGKIQDMLEGRREVFQRIMGFTRLPQDTLFVQYKDALGQKGKL